MQRIMKLQTVISKFQIFKPNLNINIQSLPWKSGKVLESTGSKSAGVSSKPTRYLSNFKNKGKECKIQKLLNGIQKLQNDIQNMFC